MAASRTSTSLSFSISSSSDRNGCRDPPRPSAVAASFRVSGLWSFMAASMISRACCSSGRVSCEKAIPVIKSDTSSRTDTVVPSVLRLADYGK